MAEATDRRTLLCVEALTAFVESGNSLLARAETESSEVPLEDFVREKIRIERPESLLGLIEAGATLFRSLSAKRKGEAEEVWRSGQQCVALQAAVEDYRQLGTQWDAFLERLDRELNPNPRTCDPDPKTRSISPETPLIDARTGECVTLRRYFGRGEKILLVLIRQFSCLLCRLHLEDLQKNQALLDARSLRVLVVSFGCQQGAHHWLQETSCPYDMLLDPQRQLYQAFGLRRSLKDVLNFSNMLRYAEYLLADMHFPKPLPSIQDDMFQLGGDFVVDQRGVVMFAHRCQSPIDRPSVSDLLATF
ncbi:unnamed protein product [Merluccius merluccius]